MIEPPIIPLFDMPIAPDIPTPALELPELEVPSYEPIFVPRKVTPGSVEQLVEPQEEEDQQEDRRESQQESQQEAQRESKEAPSAQESSPTPAEFSFEDIDIDKILQWVAPFQEQIQEQNTTDEALPVPEELPSLPSEESTETGTIDGVTTVNVFGLGIPMPEPDILVAAGATATVSVGATLASTAIYKRLVTAFKPMIKKIINSYQKLQGKETTSWARERLAQRLHKLPSTDYRDGT
jgi:outer membrane biosynthesis protein TonB